MIGKWAIGGGRIKKDSLYEVGNSVRNLLILTVELTSRQTALKTIKAVLTDLALKRIPGAGSEDHPKSPFLW